MPRLVKRRKSDSDSEPSEGDILAEADRLAGASGPRRTAGGFGNYSATELTEACKSLRGRRKTVTLPLE